MTHHASCNCGRLALACEGEPVRTAICHCRECQRRTGSAFSVHAWYQPAAVTARGDTSEYVRTAESGTVITFHFCPHCGATVYWQARGQVAVAAGAFADPAFPPMPARAVWERTRHHWLDLLAALPMEHVP